MGTPDYTEKAGALADGLRQLATFVENHPELYDDLRGVASNRLLSYLIGSPEVRDRMLRIARVAVAAGVSVSERDESRWANLDLAFGPVKVQIYTDRSWLMAEPQPPVEVSPYPSLLADVGPVCGRSCCTYPPGVAADCHCAEPVGHDGPHRSAHVGIWPEDGETPDA